MVEIHVAEDDGVEAGSRERPEERVRALTRDVERLRATVDRLETKLEKQQAKSAKWKSAAKSERTRAAKLEAALRRATSPRPSEDGDVPVTPPDD
ncbi:hypothetical protein GCM10009821_14920 [Aeromicrobium halocynthiae]|uniref:Uncharacterized protein n=1 Tax=Aeromicrobium halocynthiae TaxID=560557 RepID=A0ABN2VYC7_9ACTN